MFWLVDFLDSHALHLYEPTSTTDGSKGDDVGLVGETLLVKFLDSLIVGHITQIDYHLHHVIEPGDFEIMIGPNSRDVKKKTMTVL